MALASYAAHLKYQTVMTAREKQGSSQLARNVPRDSCLTRTMRTAGTLIIRKIFIVLLLILTEYTDTATMPAKTADLSTTTPSASTVTTKMKIISLTCYSSSKTEAASHDPNVSGTRLTSDTSNLNTLTTLREKKPLLTSLSVSANLTVLKGTESTGTTIHARLL